MVVRARQVARQVREIPSRGRTRGAAAARRLSADPGGFSFWSTRFGRSCHRLVRPSLSQGAVVRRSALLLLREGGFWADPKPLCGSAMGGLCTLCESGSEASTAYSFRVGGLFIRRGQRPCRHAQLPPGRWPDLTARWACCDTF